MIALETRGLSLSFGGVQALKGFDLTLHEGEVVGIIGPNGAGKTTLFNIIAGTIKADEGSVTLLGRDISSLGPERRASLGLIRTFQHGRTFANLSAEDNLLLGAHTRRRAGRTGVGGWAVELAQAILPFGRFAGEERQLRSEARSIAHGFGSRLLPRFDAPAFSFSYANRRRLEIARALASHPHILMLDEPTAGMNPSETLEMLELLRTLKHQGLTIIVIEHKLPLIMGISDSVVVMDDGQKIAQDHPTKIALNPRVVDAYLGRRHQRDGAVATEETHDYEPVDSAIN